MPGQGGGISGGAVAMATAGAFLLYIGIQDVGIRDGLKSIAGGALPVGKPKTNAALDKANASVNQAATASTTPVGSVSGGPHPELSAAAKKYLGVPYAWGGTTSKGVDCSGLVVLSFQDAEGITPPRTTMTQVNWSQLQEIGRGDVGAGDLLFWPSTGAPGHVGIAMSGDDVIHAPKPGDVVKIVPIREAYTGGASPKCMRWKGKAR